MRILACLIAAMVCGACGDSETTSPGPDGTRHVTQGGAQDIAEFRSIVSQGRVPAPETLDDVGFFAEHAADLPPADCGEDVCLHPMLAVAPRFNGGNWTMAFVGLNTPVDPALSERPPMHVVAIVEDSLFTRFENVPLEAMGAALQPDDRISVIQMSERAEVVARAVIPAELSTALTSVTPMPQNYAVGLYDGLATASDLIEREGFEGETRVVLVSSGHATAGITAPGRIVGLAEAMAQNRIGISVIGTGSPFENGLIAQVGDLGAGRYAYAQTRELRTLLAQEAQLSLVPLATNFSIQVHPEAGYRVGRIYGARRAGVLDGDAWLASPALFVGRRAEGPSTGRRGGGGGLFVELIADSGTDIGPNQTAFTLHANWTSSDGRTIERTIPVINERAPGQNPDEFWPEFTAPEHGNVFMMLNMYLALKTAVDFYDAGDCARSLGVVDMMAPSVETWQVEYRSEEIWADFELLLDLRDNVQSSCADTPVPPNWFEGSCFGL